ncbi:MAG: metalloregulator ArsR/SmtB family transcription factor [Candidatus Staskawiczbacteria bacterium]|nr:metalloregulator ArsR/SmtB family transcription factor [Candidatus Staskawiczbacteria bacterium]
MKAKYFSKKVPSKDITKGAQLLKAIADENRLQILQMLQSGEKCVCEIWKHLGLSQNLISHHLKVLKDLNVISSRKEGLWVFYKINKLELSKLNLLLNKFL